MKYLLIIALTAISCSQSEDVEKIDKFEFIEQFCDTALACDSELYRVADPNNCDRYVYSELTRCKFNPIKAYDCIEHLESSCDNVKDFIIYGRSGVCEETC